MGVSRESADDSLLMENGTAVPTHSNTLYIDCTATAVQFVGAPSKPIFSNDQITLQAVRAPLVATSAAIIAFVETNYDNDDVKNQLCVRLSNFRTRRGSGYGRSSAI